MVQCVCVCAYGHVCERMCGQLYSMCEYVSTVCLYTVCVHCVCILYVF